MTAKENTVDGKQPPAGPRSAPGSVGLSCLTLRHDYPAAGTHAHHAHSRSCAALILHAEGRLRSIVDGRETLHTLRPGMVGFVPADNARHTVLFSNDRPTTAFLVLLPPKALEGVADAEGIAVEPPDAIAFVDPVLHGLLQRLQRLPPGGVESCLLGSELIREAVLEATERLTGRRPDWRADDRGFDARTLADITRLVDDNVAVPIQLEQVAERVGLSPSHCARKFRLSSGMSLGRFCTLRRTQHAIERLQRNDTSLATLAIELGFSSQSHCTCTFSASTGMTPARYRRGVSSQRTRV